MGKEGGKDEMGVGGGVGRERERLEEGRRGEKGEGKWRVVDRGKKGGGCKREGGEKETSHAC